MPFDPANPPAQDLTSLGWATWQFLDRTGATQLTDPQVHNRLQLHVIVRDGVTYYRPLAAAADWITRPEAAVERQRVDIMDRFVDPFKVASDWRDLQARQDALIPPEAQPDVDGGELDTTLRFTGWG